jgi:hypothetical protein
MAKIVEQWFLFAYINGQLTPLSKPFKTRALAEKARMKYPEKKRKTVGLGLIRVGKKGKGKA